MQNSVKNTMTKKSTYFFLFCTKTKLKFITLYCQHKIQKSISTIWQKYGKYVDALPFMTN